MVPILNNTGKIYGKTRGNLGEQEGSYLAKRYRFKNGEQETSKYTVKGAAI
jgi:peptidyl-tRNA hydrolase